MELVEPDCGRIEMCEERAVYPVRIAGLEEPQGEDLLAMDIGHTLDLHFAGRIFQLPFSQCFEINRGLLNLGH